MILDKNGLVLTNYHVVRDVDEVKVQLADKSIFEAEIVGTDPQTDVAVIRMKGRVPDEPAGGGVGRFGRHRGGRPGHGHRRAVRLRADGDHRHHQRQGALRASGSTRMKTSCRPTRPSIRATRAGRW